MIRNDPINAPMADPVPPDIAVPPRTTAAINACNRFHLRVPEDVMVMGFDNVDICTMIRPSITTVSQPKFQLGYTASEILIDLLHNSNTNARNLLLSTELIIRESATSLGNEIASPTSKTT